MRHVADMEAIYTFEGTETIQTLIVTLIVGRHVTGVSAFVEVGVAGSPVPGRGELSR